MSEIVYTHTREYRDFINQMDGGRTTADQKVTIFQQPGKVAFARSVLVVGVPRGHKDKRYYYWRTVASTGFRRNSAGTVIPFSCSRPWDAKVGVQWSHKFPNEPFKLLDFEAEDDDAAEAYRRAVWYTFGFRNVNELFPMLDEYRLSNYGHIPNTLKYPFRVKDWSEYTARAFGKTRVTPRLVAAVKQTEPYIVAYAQQFRGLVDDDKMVKFIEDNHFDDEMEEGFRPHSPNIRPGLLVAHQGLRDGLIANKMDISDMARVYNMCAMGKPNVMRYFRIAKSDARNLTDLFGR
jgi:hypothetical protein